MCQHGRPSFYNILTSSSLLVKRGPFTLFTAMSMATTSFPFIMGEAKMFLVWYSVRVSTKSQKCSSWREAETSMVGRWRVKKIEQSRAQGPVVEVEWGALLFSRWQEDEDVPICSSSQGKAVVLPPWKPSKSSRRRPEIQPTEGSGREGSEALWGPEGEGAGFAWQGRFREALLRWWQLSPQ